MAKIKHTKTELKAQNEALARFERFLPMLILKKQQLQAEILSLTHKIDELKSKYNQQMDDIQNWIRVAGEPFELESLIDFERVAIDEGNIAGVEVPLFREAVINLKTPDLLQSPAWVDDVLLALKELLTIKAERETLEEERRRIQDELQTTAQRVNLFEKVKIPECKENIRVIKIYLGDEQTAAVARGKIAKKRTAGGPADQSEQQVAA